MEALNLKTGESMMAYFQGFVSFGEGISKLAGFAAGKKTPLFLVDV